jgi:acetoin utilization deacetylase AcuC-like enzyme
LFLDHEAPGYHPERPERLSAIWGALDQTDVGRAARRFPARAATTAELERAHDARYVRLALGALERGSGYFDPDTYFSPGSRAAALGAAGGCLDAALAMHGGDVDVVFGAHRPPGHHATRAAAMGFCIFNNIAIAAAGLLAAGVERVMIYDFDVHHGNGTQEAFWRDPHVLYVSSHQFPFYPGTGDLDEVGEGDGRGFTVNLPLPAGTGDTEYSRACREIVEPIGRAFDPELVLVSAGFDAHRDDPLGGMAVTPPGFAELMDVCLAVASGAARGRVVAVLEGGYDIDGIATSTAAVVGRMLGRPKPPLAGAPASGFDRRLEAFRATHGRYWPVLKA